MSDIFDNSEDVLDKQVAEALQMELDLDPTLVNSLNGFLDVFKECQNNKRISLRSEIEKRTIMSYEKLLNSYKNIKQNVDELCSDFQKMNSSLNEMVQNFNKSKSEPQILLKKCSEIYQKRNECDLKHAFVSKFIEKFQLNENDLSILGRHLKNDQFFVEDLFKVIEKIRQIRENCQLLLDSGHQKIAINIIDQMDEHYNKAMEHLYKWTLNHCRIFERAKIYDLVQRSMPYLENQPEHFRCILEEYCSIRRDILASNFIGFLTKGPEALDLRNHDSEFYVHELLQWIFESLFVEKKRISSFLKDCSLHFRNEQIPNAIIVIADSICDTLTIRFDNTLSKKRRNLSEIYTIFNLIRFFEPKISELLPSGLLITTIKELKTFSEQLFYSSLENTVTNYLISLERPSKNLAPTKIVVDILSIMKDLLSKMMDLNRTNEEIHKCAIMLINPLLNAINEQASRLTIIDMSVYLLNCFYAIQITIKPFEIFGDVLERIEAQCEAQVDTLSSEQANYFLDQIHLRQLYLRTQEKDANGSSVLSANRLKEFNMNLNSFIEASDKSGLSQIDLLISTNVKILVQKKCFEIICAVYKKLYEFVIDPKNGYKTPETILTFQPNNLMYFLCNKSNNL